MPQHFWHNCLRVFFGIPVYIVLITYIDEIHRGFRRKYGNVLGSILYAATALAIITLAMLAVMTMELYGRRLAVALSALRVPGWVIRWFDWMPLPIENVRVNYAESTKSPAPTGPTPDWEEYGWNWHIG